MIEGRRRRIIDIKSLKRNRREDVIFEMRSLLKLQGLFTNLYAEMLAFSVRR
jgi:hypothetical protein